MRTATSKPNYHWTISDLSFEKAERLRNEQAGRLKPLGKKVKDHFNKLFTFNDEIGVNATPTDLREDFIQEQIKELSTQGFLDVLNKTRPYAIYAETDISGDGSDWTAEELSLMGDMSVVMDNVTVFDDGSFHKTGADSTDVVADAPKFILGFTAGALLAGCSTDLNKEVLGDPREIGGAAYTNLKKLYERRLLPVLIDFNAQAAREGKQAYVSIPGLGCGQFAGQFDNLHETFGNILQEIISDHADELSSIGEVRYFHGGTEYRGLQKAEKNIKGLKFSQCDAYASKGFGDIPQGMMPCKVVAWDHASYPTNDALRGARQTDDGVTGACTNALDAFTPEGVTGQYNNNPNSNGGRFFLTPTGERNWGGYLGNLGHSLDTASKLTIVDVTEVAVAALPIKTPFSGLSEDVQDQLLSLGINRDTYEAADTGFISSILGSLTTGVATATVNSPRHAAAGGGVAAVRAVRGGQSPANSHPMPSNEEANAQKIKDLTGLKDTQLNNLEALAIPHEPSAPLINQLQLDYISRIPNGHYQAEGLRSWCLKETASLPNGQTLVHFSTSRRPAGAGQSSAEALYVTNPDGSVASYLGFKSSHSDADFGIGSDSVVRAKDGKIFFAKRDAIKSFGMRDENGNPLLPDSDDSIKEISDGMLTENIQNTISLFERSTNYFQSRCSTTSLIKDPATELLTSSPSVARKINSSAAPLPITNNTTTDLSVKDLRDLMEFVPIDRSATGSGNKLISVNGVDVFLNGSNNRISVNRGVLPSGNISAGVYSDRDVFFNNISAGANVAATSGSGKKVIEELTRNKNSLLTKILFSIEDPQKFKNFLLIHAAGENVSRKLVDENGRNILHHLVESAQDPGSINKANVFLAALLETLPHEQIKELTLAGDAFHFKTPFSIAATNPQLSDLTAKLIPLVASDINQLDANGNTPLHWATLKHSSENSNLKTIGNLIKAGANPNIIDSSIHAQSSVAVAAEKETAAEIGQFTRRFKSRVATATEQNNQNNPLPTILLGSLCNILENRRDLQPSVAKDLHGRFYLQIPSQSDQNLAFGFSAYSKSPYLEFTQNNQVMHLAIKEDGSVGLYSNNPDRTKTEITDARCKPEELTKSIINVAKAANVTELGGVKCDEIGRSSAVTTQASAGGRRGR